jgi:hypothetical protein
MTEKPKTVEDELTDIAADLFDRARLEIESGVRPSDERVFALGLASGAVLRVRAEWSAKKSK